MRLLLLFHFWLLTFLWTRLKARAEEADRSKGWAVVGVTLWLFGGAWGVFLGAGIVLAFGWPEAAATLISFSVATLSRPTGLLVAQSEGL